MQKYKLIKVEDDYILACKHKNIPSGMTAVEIASGHYYIIASSTGRYDWVDILQLSLKNCEAIERGYDLDELVEECVDEYTDRFDYNDGQGNRKVYSNSDVIEKVYTIAFQKALEILGDKKFSEEQLRKAFFHVQNEPTFDVFKKSLQQTEWDVIYNPNEKDADGCLILRKI